MACPLTHFKHTGKIKKEEDRFNAMPSKIPAKFFKALERMVLNFI